MKIELSGEQLARVCMSTLRAALGAERYVYLSGPISGGWRFVDWHVAAGRWLDAPEAGAARRREVVAPNIKEIKVEADRQRAGGLRMIEPGSFEADFENWGQPEFLAFWDQVLERHAASVRFMPGWAYSAGCAFEYQRALAYGLPRLDLGGEDLSRRAACDALDRAMDHIADLAGGGDPRDRPLLRLHDAIGEQRTLIATVG